MSIDINQFQLTSTVFYKFSRLNNSFIDLHWNPSQLDEFHLSIYDGTDCRRNLMVWIVFLVVLTIIIDVLEFPLRSIDFLWLVRWFSWLWPHVWIILKSFSGHFEIILTSKALLGHSKVLLGDLGVIISDLKWFWGSFLIYSRVMLESFWVPTSMFFETRLLSLVVLMFESIWERFWNENDIIWELKNDLREKMWIFKHLSLLK